MARTTLSLGRDIAIDLGASNTLIFVKGEGIVLDEPSTAAVDKSTGQLVAVGQDAKRMWGRVPANLRLVRPLESGIIVDFDVCEQMLREFIRHVTNSRWSKPRMVIAVPSVVTGVEKRAVQDAAEFAGARRPVYLIEKPMAAAIGCGLPVGEPSANLIVEIGGGTAEVAVISMGGIVTVNSVRTAGDELDKAIVAGFRKAYALDIGVNTAEEVKIQIGSAWPLAEEFSAEVGGRDAVTGLPRTQVVTTEEVRAMLEDPVATMIDAIRTTLERTPAELAADVINNGLVLSGGTALLVGLAERITNDTGIEAFTAEEPLHSVVLGCGMALDNLEALRNMSSRDIAE